MHPIAFLVYAVIVAAGSLSPGGDARFASLDKIVHLLVYYIFAVLGYRALQNKRRYPLLCAVIVAYGAVLELCQSFVPGREMSLYDLVANIAGVALGAAVMIRRYAQN